MRLRDIKDPSDLRDMSSNDVVDLLDELRALATERGTALLKEGRVQARRALGAPEPGAVGTALIFGIALGALVGAVAAVLMTPMRGSEARRRLAEQADQVRERMPQMAKTSGNGRVYYEPTVETPMPSSTARPMV